MSDKIRTRLPCYQQCTNSGRACEETGCKFWSSSPGTLNCAILAAGGRVMTLQQVANFLGVSRMRVCQIEATAQSKIVERFTKNSELNEYDVLTLLERE